MVKECSIILETCNLVYDKLEGMDYVKKLIYVFGVFFIIGIQTFGGGLAMLPILENELVTKRGWTTKDTLLDYYAIGQATPGIIAVNVSTFLGYSQAGLLGGIMGTLGVITPSIIIIESIALLFENFGSNVYVSKALIGINVAVAALLIKVFVGFFKTAVLKKNTKGNVSKSYVFLGLILVVWGFGGLTFLGINSAFIMLSGIIAGVLIHFVSKRRVLKDDDK